MTPIWNCQKCHPTGGRKHVAPYEAADGRCPECQRSPADVEPGEPGIRRLSRVHLILRDDAGPKKIWNHEVGRDLGWKFACGDPQPDPDDLDAGGRPTLRFTGSAKGNPTAGAVTCPDCRNVMANSEGLSRAL